MSTLGGAMPIDYKKYPPDWKETRARILKRADNQCECQGECGLHHDHRCTELNGMPAKWANGKVVLTIAHLDHDEENWGVDDSRLKAMCQRCHLRYDAPEKARRRKSKKAIGDLFE